MTTEDIDAGIAALVKALSTGELKVRFADGREVTYQSAADIQSRLAALRRERAALLAGDAGPISRPRFYLVNAIR
ncbi:phage head-tail joining protein [Roseococcus pinisoli]|uniref:GpW protein n=1 Tax=Roseococcus pinisoli TaxID=2835040 RepID=A0ABS5QAJ7_9PROT|nr:hypothetical protein [Roseococcus pinisoli]MBS7810527.1 hypothetical protein [Roseococcus pinisoli]